VKFARVHKVLIFAAALCAALPLILSFELSLAAGPAFAALFLAGLIAGDALGRSRPVRRGVTGAAILFFVAQIVRVAFGTPVAGALLEYGLALLGLKLCTRRQFSDDQQIIALSFITLTGATVTSYGISYGVFFALFVLIAPSALSLTHLRREMEHRFAKDEESIHRLLQSKRIVSAGFLASTTFIALPVLVLTLLLFAAIPRLGIGFGGNLSVDALPGFTSTVAIGDLRDVMADTTVYARLWPDAAAGTPPRRLDLRLRGAVFDVFDNGTWRATTEKFVPVSRRSGVFPLSTPAARPMIRLRIMQAPTRPPLLFVPEGTFAVETDRLVVGGHGHRRRLEVNGAAVVRYEDPGGTGLQFDALVNGAPLPGAAAVPAPDWLAVPQGLSRLAALAERFTRDASTPGERVRAIVAGLRQYRYARRLSDGEWAAAQNVDPLHAFLFVHRKGTCEHFATAATLMLRTQGVPARFVTGFLGAKWNDVGGYYTVSADAAHAWTEVLIDGTWRTVDATPPGQGGAGGDGAESTVAMALDAAAMHWHRWIIDWDMGSQTALLRDLRSGVRLPRLPRLPVAPLLIAIGLVAAAVVLYRRRSRTTTPSLRRGRTGSADRATALYLALERRLSRQKPRPPGETALEFINGISLSPGDASIARAVLSAYHDARFGGRPMDPDEAARLRRQLRQISVYPVKP